jgi:hypothetical protein
MNRQSIAHFVFGLVLLAGLINSAHAQVIRVGRDHETVDLLAKMPSTQRSNLPDGVSITHTTLHGGRQEGVELVRIYNGKLRSPLSRREA